MNRRSLRILILSSAFAGAAGCATPVAGPSRSDDFYQTRLNVTTGGVEDSAAAAKRIALQMKQLGDEVQKTAQQVQLVTDELSRQQGKLKRVSW